MEMRCNMNNIIKFCETCSDGLEEEDNNIYNESGECTSCGCFISKEEIQRHNTKVSHDTYRVENDIISLKQIQELPTKYNIGKRPLSHLLQWGELTFTRYYNGDIPSKTYSQLLKEIYNSPQKYLDILETNQEYVAKKAYEKSKFATLELMQTNSKLNDVLGYILSKTDDVTPLATQKLLYYCQGFHFAFFDKPLFEDECIATENGPYYQNVTKNNLLIEFNLNKNEMVLIDTIIKYFACYSSSVLTDFTTSELPYLKTCINNNIKSDDILIYFSSLKNKYNMLSLIDIKNYTLDIFRNEN